LPLNKSRIRIKDKVKVKVKVRGEVKCEGRPQSESKPKLIEIEGKNRVKVYWYSIY